MICSDAVGSLLGVVDGPLFRGDFCFLPRRNSRFLPFPEREWFLLERTLFF